MLSGVLTFAVVILVVIVARYVLASIYKQDKNHDKD